MADFCNIIVNLTRDPQRRVVWDPAHKAGEPARLLICSDATELQQLLDTAVGLTVNDFSRILQMHRWAPAPLPRRNLGGRWYTTFVHPVHTPETVQIHVQGDDALQRFLYPHTDIRLYQSHETPRSTGPAKTASKKRAAATSWPSGPAPDQGGVYAPPAMAPPHQQPAQPGFGSVLDHGGLYAPPAPLSMVGQPQMPIQPPSQHQQQQGGMWGSEGGVYASKKQRLSSGQVPDRRLMSRSQGAAGGVQRASTHGGLGSAHAWPPAGMGCYESAGAGAMWPAPLAAQGYHQPGYGQVSGYDQPGYNQPGYNQPGYNQPGYNQPGYNQPGYNQPGYDQPGHDQQGYGQVSGYGGQGSTRRQAKQPRSSLQQQPQAQAPAPGYFDQDAAGYGHYDEGQEDWVNGYDRTQQGGAGQPSQQQPQPPALGYFGQDFGYDNISGGGSAPAGQGAGDPYDVTGMSGLTGLSAQLPAPGPSQPHPQQPQPQGATDASTLVDGGVVAPAGSSSCTALVAVAPESALVPAAAEVTTVAAGGPDASNTVISLAVALLAKQKELQDQFKTFMEAHTRQAQEMQNTNRSILNSMVQLQQQRLPPGPAAGSSSSAAAAAAVAAPPVAPPPFDPSSLLRSDEVLGTEPSPVHTDREIMGLGMLSSAAAMQSTWLDMLAATSTAATAGVAMTHHGEDAFSTPVRKT